MNPYINHMAGFGAYFSGFYPLEQIAAATGTGHPASGFLVRFGRMM